MFLALLNLINLSVAQDIPSIPNCGLNPVDPACLVKNAQYTVVGTITSITGKDTSPSRYNATMVVRCAYASFSSPPSDGAGLVGNEIKVANWGKPQPRCPTGAGAEAIMNQTQIYFLYVGQRPPAGIAPKDILYSVQSICVGGVDFSDANKQTVAQVLNDYPSNAIPTSNFGTEAGCALPAVVNSDNGGGNGNGGGTEFKNSEVKTTAAVLFILGLIGLGL